MLTDTWAALGKINAYNWDWHLEHANLTPIPGTDWNFAPGENVPSMCSGYCSWARMDDGLYMVSVQYGADAITVRELGTISAAVKNHYVTAGAPLGTASSIRFPHREYDHANGTYSPVENYFTPTPTPAPQPVEEEPMPFMIYVLSPSKGTVWGHALVSADLSKCVTISQAAANGLIKISVLQLDEPVTVADWNAFKTAAGEPVDTIV